MPTDNSGLRAKLELRRYFLRKYHADQPPRVFDACQATGKLWAILREEFGVASYWGVDIKPRKGTLKVDSRRLLERPIAADVIDIDTYGSPWKHWDALLKNLTGTVTVFLTLGTHGSGPIRSEALGGEILNMPPKTPTAIKAKMAHKLAVRYWLTRSCDYGINIVEAVEAVEAVGSRTARYFGVRLNKIAPPGGADGASHIHAEKEREHAENDHSLDRPHVQSVDGLHQGQRRLQKLLRRDADQEPHGPPPVGSAFRASGHESAMGERADVEPRGRTRWRHPPRVLRLAVRLGRRPSYMQRDEAPVVVDHQAVPVALLSDVDQAAGKHCPLPARRLGRWLAERLDGDQHRGYAGRGPRRSPAQDTGRGEVYQLRAGHRPAERSRHQRHRLGDLWRRVWSRLPAGGQAMGARHAGQVPRVWSGVLPQAERGLPHRDGDHARRQGDPGVPGASRDRRTVRLTNHDRTDQPARRMAAGFSLRFAFSRQSRRSE